jgi:hypothetical protein
MANQRLSRAAADAASVLRENSKLLEGQPGTRAEDLLLQMVTAVARWAEVASELGFGDVLSKAQSVRRPQDAGVRPSRAAYRITCKYDLEILSPEETCNLIDVENDTVSDALFSVFERDGWDPSRYPKSFRQVGLEVSVAPLA